MSIFLNTLYEVKQSLMKCFAFIFSNGKLKKFQKDESKTALLKTASK